MAKEKLELTDKSVAELQADLGSMENEYQQMKFEHSVKGLGNPLELRQLRRDIARVNTELRAREMAELTPDQLALRTKLQARRRRQR